MKTPTLSETQFNKLKTIMHCKAGLRRLDVNVEQRSDGSTVAAFSRGAFTTEITFNPTAARMKEKSTDTFVSMIVAEAVDNIAALKNKADKENTNGC